MPRSRKGSSETSDNKTTPFPRIDEEVSSQEKDVKDKDGATPTKSKRRDGAPSHKRSVSGSLLSRLSFLRTASDQGRGDGTTKEAVAPSGGAAGNGGGLPLSGGRSAMAEAQAHGKRRRKGSLRKTVLGKGRDGKSSGMKKSPLSSANATPVQTPLQEQALTPRASADLSSPVSPDSPPSWPFRTLSRVSIPSIRSSIASVDPASSAASLVSPTVPTDASTDDEDLVLPRMPLLRQIPSTTSFGDSYFPIQDPVRRMFGSRARSPLASAPESMAGTPPADEGWDYSETAFWGYVILVVTWLVFVVGMGSCFGVWSWAWDVGETPYAPPELEDDPTLPIVGYYPALLVLTCVMAWVWVVVAWVGMKYFRHADFKGDD